MRKSSIFIVTISFCCWLVCVDAVAARPDRLLLAQSASLSQDEAAMKVREETGGRVLDVKTSIKDGLTVYRIKVLLPDGHVRVVTVTSQ